MFSYLQDRIQLALRQGEYLHIIMILLAILTLAFLKIFISAVVASYVWNTFLVSVIPSIKYVSVLDIIILRIGYFAFQFIS